MNPKPEAGATFEKTFRLSPAGRQKAFKAYCGQSAFFPLIAAVLAGSQQGEAFGDDPDSPSRFHVEHAFGFAQIIGAITPGFEVFLRKRLLLDKDFAPAKIRLYTPTLPEFLAGAAGKPFRSERRRFFLDRAAFSARRALMDDDIANTRPVSTENMGAVNSVFDLTTRFWPDCEAFLAKASAMITYDGSGAPAAICYAAAVENGRAEIDVLTAPALRGRGFGLRASAAFIDRCLGEGIEPLWDCFTNNAGSLALAASLGFKGGPAPYAFFTIPRQ